MGVKMALNPTRILGPTVCYASHQAWTTALGPRPAGWELPIFVPFLNMPTPNSVAPVTVLFTTYLRLMQILSARRGLPD